MGRRAHDPRQRRRPARCSPVLDLDPTPQVSRTSWVGTVETHYRGRRWVLDLHLAAYLDGGYLVTAISTDPKGHREQVCGDGATPLMTERVAAAIDLLCTDLRHLTTTH